MEASTLQDFTLPFPEDDMTMSQVDAGTCGNQVKDNDESDVDCGGSCMGCTEGKTCNLGKDCRSGACANKLCLAPTCMDTIKNGTESDVDCGGSCPTKCENGQTCGDGPDCKSGFCLNGKCMMSQCQDGMRNGMESDVDCGGPMCPKCVDGQMCNDPMDCMSGRCASGTCRPPQGTVGFAKPVNYPLDGTGYVTGGDFNEDGLLDLAVVANAVMGSARYFIFASVGDGTFTKPQNAYVGINAKAGVIVAADFNGDGHLDLASSNFDVTGIPGNGDGTFIKAWNGGVPAWQNQGTARYLIAGRFNADNLTDLVEGTPLATPTFLHPSRMNLPMNQWPLVQLTLLQTATTGGVVADFDADGALDLALTTARTVTIQKGDGAEHFQEVAVLTPGTMPNDLVAADFNKDGKLDLAVANEGSGDCSIFLGQGGAIFGAPTTVKIGTSPAYTATGDFNKDSKLDLLFLTTDMNNNRSVITIVLGSGNGQFQAPKSYPMGGTTGGAAVVADFNKDGYSDVAYVQWSPAKALSIMLNLAN